jgi:hypothetical protein
MEELKRLVASVERIEADIKTMEQIQENIKERKEAIINNAMDAIQKMMDSNITSILSEYDKIVSTRAEKVLASVAPGSHGESATARDVENVTPTAPAVLSGSTGSKSSTNPKWHQHREERDRDGAGMWWKRLSERRKPARNGVRNTRN